MVNKYREESGEQQTHFGVIHKNPEQSKHLETATMQINHMWIDFVNLRTEEYTDTRIPVIVSAFLFSLVDKHFWF